MTHKCKTYPMPPKICFPVTSLLSLLHLHVRNLLLITRCNGRLMSSGEPESLKLTDSCYFSCVVFIYFLNIAQLLVQGGDASGECLLFVVTDQRRPSCLMCGWGWLSAVQLRCCLFFFFDCVKPIDASQLLPPLPSPRSHVLATRGLSRWTAATVGRIG